MAKTKYVIIGNSAAALGAIEAIRKVDTENPIAVVCKDKTSIYSRALLTYLLREGFDESKIFLRPKEFYSQMGVEFLPDKEVVSVDTKGQKVQLADNSSISYDKLLIASGGVPYVPHIKGMDGIKLFTLRHLEDAREIIDEERYSKKIAFLGAGLVCLQVLNSMYKKGKEYSLIVTSQQILSQMLDRGASQLLEENMRLRGIEILKGRSVTEIGESKGKKQLILDDGSQMEADMVIVGKGVVPNVEFLKDSSIDIDEGILVNDFMETNIPGIYAAGDVAQAPDFLLEKKTLLGIWPDAVIEGRVAGFNMAGRRIRYNGGLRINVTWLFGLPSASLGILRNPGKYEEISYKDPEHRIYRSFLLEDNRIIGASLIGKISDIGCIHDLIRKRIDVTPWKEALARAPFKYGNRLKEYALMR